MKDNIAIACSGLCLVHCVVTPIVMGLAALGAVSAWLDSPWIHQLMLVPVILLALLSLPFAYIKHGNHVPMIMVVLGISAMVSTFFLPEHYEFWITIPAALVIMSGHFWNRQLIAKTALVMEPSNG
ncbi:MerC domain-containing protein [Methylophaga sulfidovorans]|uniref:MerC mercury resistance protein n=1 Tax=Methylophaga sulfidovorans TaxID=45496 RepID=A0A1I3ZZY4_9GAMM|nr:MerC domain-containing protein [Methylophaga sulfidovorans]SFK49089.1 MerC mercury resistance protein [Methylophaga sulfidovorans]